MAYQILSNRDFTPAQPQDDRTQMESEFKTIAGLNILFNPLLSTLNLLPDQWKGQLRNAKLESDPSTSGTFTKQYRFVALLDGAPEEERGGQIGHAEGAISGVNGGDLPHTIHYSQPVAAAPGIGLVPLIPIAYLVVVIAAIAALAFVFGPVLYKIEKVAGSRAAIVATIAIVVGVVALGSGLFRGIRGGVESKVRNKIEPGSG